MPFSAGTDHLFLNSIGNQLKIKQPSLRKTKVTAVIFILLFSIIRIYKTFDNGICWNTHFINFQYSILALALSIVNVVFRKNRFTVYFFLKFSAVSNSRSIFMQIPLCIKKALQMQGFFRYFLSVLTYSSCGKYPTLV